MQQELTLLYEVALAHRDARDPARDVGADVHLLLGLDFSAGGDRGDEIAASDGLEPHLDALLALGAGTDDHQQDDEYGPAASQQHLVPLGHVVSILSVNASCGRPRLRARPGPCGSRTSR